MLDIALEEFADHCKPNLPSEFQSFLCWILLWKEASLPVRSFLGLFQSFLCWILLWKLLMYKQQKELEDCFNPSYAGYCSGSKGPNNPRRFIQLVSILLMLDIALEGVL